MVAVHPNPYLPEMLLEVSSRDIKIHQPASPLSSRLDNMHCSDATPLCSRVSPQSSPCEAVLWLGGRWAVWSSGLSHALDPSLHVLDAGPCDCSARGGVRPDPLRSLPANSLVTLWSGHLPTPRLPAVAEEGGVLTGPGLMGMTGVRSVEGKKTGLQSQQWGRGVGMSSAAAALDNKLGSECKQFLLAVLCMHV